ncbi:putative Sergef protein [Danaus plexippus plexippus]|uniref:Sergef protein n=1 Tax=Danaus plexippus plexippus TaxID=278856 RepID=A0A212FNM7_DANPL|nr:putative Sergef protein [Danaus plexippus plexippus]
MWSWGANSHGQLGLDSTSEQIDKPTEVSTEHLSDIQQIACGGGHTLLLAENGKLFSCGWNSRRQLGYEQEVYTFKRVWGLSGIHFLNIACGWDFSCGVTDDKFLFVWGSNSYGQLGLPKNEFPDEVKPVRLQVNACSVSMGLRHTAIINSKGEVWTTGCGRHGQLGLGHDVLKADRFQRVPKLSVISHIACGQNHTVGWSSEEKALYVWGDNKHGQLLLSSEKYKRIYKPEKIDIDVKRDVKKVLSGWTNVLLWLQDGSLLTWGRNNYGQLGTDALFTGKIIHINLPGGRQVKDIVLGSEHTVCLATDNTLWAWGWNEHGNTGTSLGDCIFQPVRVPIDSKIKISQIYAGSAHNFIVTDKSPADNTYTPEDID